MIALFLPPGFDEAYYYLYTRHLDWSYFDHPPLVALSTGIGPWLTGNVSQFTIRLGTLILHTAALGLLYLTGCRLFSTQAARLTLAIATLIPIFLVGFGVLTLPDAPLIFFWTATLYVSACEFFPPPASSPCQSYTPTFRLALIGLLVGFACLSKYHGAALGFGLIGFCLTTPRYRAALVSPWTLASLGLFTLAIAPILIWNGQHDWVSLRFQSGRAVPDRGYSLIDLLVTFLAGIAYMFPTFGLPLWWVTGKAGVGKLREWLGRGVGKRREIWEAGEARKATLLKSSLSSPVAPPSSLLLWLSLPLMLGFTLMGGYRPIMPTWPMPGFWSATLFLGQAAAVLQEKSSRLVRRWLWGSGLVVISFLLVALLHVNLGTLQKPSSYAFGGGFLTPKADASVQLMDIQQLRQGVIHSPEVQNALADSSFLFTDNIFLAGQVGMAISPVTPKPVTTLDTDMRGFAYWSRPNEWVGQNGLLIASEWQTPVDVGRYSPYFEQIQKVGEIPIRRGGAIVQTIHVYHAQNLLKPYPRNYG